MDKSNVFVANKLRSKKIRGNSRHLTSLKSFLKEETFDFNSEVWNFKSDLTYKNIEYIIKQLKRLSRQQKIKLVISESIYSFIDAQKFEIEEISKLGLRIKNKDEILLSDFEKFSEIVNSETSRPLRNIQMWVSYYMSKMKRVGNFSVPGAGKTAMIYGTYAYLSSPKIDEVKRIVVIGPKNSFKSWKDEFFNVFGNKKKLSVLDIHSPDFNEVMLVQHLSNYNLFLFNYESINKYKDILLKLVDDKTLLVFDEVHRIKGIESKRAVYAIEIAQNARYRFLLTGTPLPNGYQDLWNMLQILYMNEYQDYFNIEKHELKNMTEDKIQIFNEDFFPFYWRVTKKELGVPDAEPDNIVSVNMTKDEQEILNLLYRKYRGNPFVLYGRLIQFSSNPQLLKYNLERSLFETNDDDEELTFEYNQSMYDSPTFSNEEITLIDKVSESSKFIKAMNHSEQLIKDGRTIIIWCIFINTIEKVEKAMKEKGFRVAVIYGAIPTYERERIITDFQNGFYDVLITNPHTLGESVSLHNVSHDALYLEYSFNLTHMLQSRDRIHRLGLDENTKTNYYYYLLEGTDDFRNTIDRKIYDRLKDKEITMVNAVENTHISIVDNFDEDKEILKLLGDLK
ncbi:DEAD/DEAH box helicase [Nosocomiicoccus ampullae]|uniref:DEAD/DEAH box helicase n=1 Tax=Nosocomiicoccus ampullae TaxID=489910 RepID=UPI00254F658B|nr:DEAD/DEAH box helicase [Nosocomiicoccus ampullae]